MHALHARIQVRATDLASSEENRTEQKAEVEDLGHRLRVEGIGLSVP